jgi:hypothetical protein
MIEGSRSEPHTNGSGSGARKLNDIGSGSATLHQNTSPTLSNVIRYLPVANFMML